MHLRLAHLVCLLSPIAAAHSAELSGHQLRVISDRTGDTEIFIADPVPDDICNVSRPGWVTKFDGSTATLVEPLGFQTAIDGSRASRKPTSR